MRLILIFTVGLFICASFVMTEDDDEEEDDEDEAPPPPKKPLAPVATPAPTKASLSITTTKTNAQTPSPARGKIEAPKSAVGANEDDASTPQELSRILEDIANSINTLARDAMGISLDDGKPGGLGDDATITARLNKIVKDMLKAFSVDNEVPDLSLDSGDLDDTEKLLKTVQEILKFFNEEGDVKTSDMGNLDTKSEADITDNILKTVDEILKYFYEEGDSVVGADSAQKGSVPVKPGVGQPPLNLQKQGGPPVANKPGPQMPPNKPMFPAQAPGKPIVPPTTTKPVNKPPAPQPPANKAPVPPPKAGAPPAKPPIPPPTSKTTVPAKKAAAAADDDDEEEDE